VVVAMSTISTERGIRAIETLYRGCRFRSRLEARWAVFFQTLGVPWHYEPQGYVLSTGQWYLPDFLVDLKDRSLWVEVKPRGISTPLFEQFMLDIKQPGTILHEIPDPERIEGSDFEHEDYHFRDEGRWDIFYQFCICTSCNAVGFEFEGRSARIRCGCNKHGCDRDHTYDHPRILKALTAARSARFEAER
jgi:hypothetical protein